MLFFKKKEKNESPFIEIGQYCDGYALAKLQNGNCVFINREQEIVSKEYHYAKDFCGGRAVVRIADGSNYFLIDRKMQRVSDNYEYIINSFKEGYASVCVLYPNQEGYLTRNGTYFQDEEHNLVFAMSKLFKDLEITAKEKKLLMTSQEALDAIIYECRYRIDVTGAVDFGYKDNNKAISELKEIQKEFEGYSKIKNNSAEPQM